MVTFMCGPKVVDRKMTKDRLGLKETADGLATANRVRYYGHVLMRNNDSALKVALELEVGGKKRK